MTAVTDSAARAAASRSIIQRYYLAMAVPFGIDFATSIVYAGINAELHVVLPMMAISAAFLLVGVGIGAWLSEAGNRRHNGEAVVHRIDPPA